MSYKLKESVTKYENNATVLRLKDFSNTNFVGNWTDSNPRIFLIV